MVPLRWSIWLLPVEVAVVAVDQRMHQAAAAVPVGIAHLLLVNPLVVGLLLRHL